MKGQRRSFDTELEVRPRLWHTTTTKREEYLLWATALASSALAKLKRSWGKRSFDRVAEGILSTAPLCLQGDSPLFLSVVCHRDVAAYLLAIKSLYVGVGHGRLVVINDGSLISDDLVTLRHHIPDLEVIDINAIETGPSCPRAGCWERLVKIVELSADNYVIQADADILASSAIPEVIQCWQENRSFLLGTGAGQQISTAQATARMVQGWIKTHNWNPPSVGVEAEALLDTLPNAAQRSYVHASAGFAGFARGAFRMSDLEWFSTYMNEMLGAQRWREWGTEQIASNYILANALGTSVLPFPKYACFEPHLKQGNHALLHFIGSYRYNGGVYRRRAAEFISCYSAPVTDQTGAVGGGVVGLKTR